MTNPNLSDFKFNDLLPLSVKDDPKFLAASECLDKLFTGFDERVKSVLVYSRIDELDRQQLDDLAEQWNIGYYEGYQFAESLEDKRALVKHAIMLHWHKGTVWAMKAVPEFLGMPSFLIEWFDADLLGTHMEHHEFDLAIDTSVRGASPTIQQDIRKLINAIKNVRSYLRNIILMSTWKVTAYYGAQGQGVNFGTIRPMWWPGGDAYVKYSWGAGSYGAATGRVRPHIWHEKAITMIHAWTIGGLGLTSGRVNPKFWPGADIPLKHGRAVGGQGFTSGRVRPKAWLGGEALLKHGRAAGSYGAVAGSVIPKLSFGGDVLLLHGKAAGSYGAVTSQVTPKRWYGGSVTVSKGRATGNYFSESARVLPKMWMGNIFTLVNKENRIGTYAATVGRVYPKATI